MLIKKTVGDTLPLCELMGTIRDLVNEPSLQDSLMANIRLWNIITSAMDAVEDTDLAIEAYLHSINRFELNDENYSLQKGMAYLLCSGALQTMFAQQDAASELCKCLSIKVNIFKEPKLHDIREIRNASIGHPTEHKGKESNFIIQHTLAPAGFELWSFGDGHEYKIKHVSLLDLIADQRKCLSNILQKIIKELNAKRNPNDQL